MKKIYCLEKIITPFVFVLLFSLCSFFIFPTFSYAQSIGINVNVGAQSIFNHDIPLNITVLPENDVSQVKVQWILPYGLNALGTEKSSYNVGLSANNPLYDHFVIIPQYPGEYSVTANISGIYNSQQFNKSASVFIVIDSHLHVTNNITNDSLTHLGNADLYVLHKTIFIILSIAFFVLFVFMSKDVYTYFRHKFLNWLNRES